MNKEDIKKTLFRYIQQAYEIPENDKDFTYDVHIFDYGYVDSLGAADILTFIEKTYPISVTQKDLMLFPMNTVTEMADYISQKLGE